MCGWVNRGEETRLERGKKFAVEVEGGGSGWMEWDARRGEVDGVLGLADVWFLFWGFEVCSRCGVGY